MRLCLFCQSPLPADADSRQKHCSRLCSGRKAAAKKRQGPFPKTCANCSTEFVALKPKQRFCSPECRYVKQLEESNARYRAFREANPIPDSFDYTCDICNVTFTKPHRVTGIAIQRGVYCDDCRLIAQQARYRKKTVRRQSQTRPSGVWVEQILEAYGSICYLCNNNIDMNLARTSRNGATVDHVIPLSRGGTDELENLRLAHWSCNLKKSDKLVEELDAESW